MLSNFDCISINFCKIPCFEIHPYLRKKLNTEIKIRNWINFRVTIRAFILKQASEKGTHAEITVDFIFLPVQTYISLAFRKDPGQPVWNNWPVPYPLITLIKRDLPQKPFSDRMTVIIIWTRVISESMFLSFFSTTCLFGDLMFYLRKRLQPLETLKFRLMCI